MRQKTKQDSPIPRKRYLLLACVLGFVSPVGILPALQSIGGLIPPAASVDIEANGDYTLAANYSSWGTRETGRDTDSDGRLDRWTVYSDPDPNFRFAYQAQDLDADGKPDKRMAVIGHPDGAKSAEDTLFMVGYVTTEAKGARPALSVRLGNWTDASTQVRYDDLNQDGRLDRRRDYTGGKVMGTWLYFENRWAKASDADPPYTIEERPGGPLIAVAFRAGFWFRSDAPAGSGGIAP